MKVRQILASKGMKVITIQPQQSIRDAVITLAQHNIGALVVVNDQAVPIGIISERDIVRRAAEAAEAAESIFTQSVQDVMTLEVVTGMPQDDIFSVAATMTDRRFRHLPIVEDGQLVGIVTMGDIMKAERDQYRGEIDTLETQIMADPS